MFEAVIYIEGDWKHAHGYADSLFAKEGFTVKDEGNIKEDGSDWYASDHSYSVKVTG